MSRVGRVARVGALVVVAAGVAVGAARVPGTVEPRRLAGQAGLPQVSSVLVDEATIVCPGQQRLGAAGLRNVSGDVRVGASPAPADTLRAAGVAPPPGAGQVDLESGASGAVMATGHDRRTRRRARDLHRAGRGACDGRAGARFPGHPGLEAHG